MRRFIAPLILVTLLCAAPAMAETVTFGSKVLSEGDSVARVYEVAGKPDAVIQLENKFGGATGQRFEYYRGGKQISIVVAGGVVQSITVSNG